MAREARDASASNKHKEIDEVMAREARDASASNKQQPLYIQH
jgi:hypothetical protein